MTFDGSDQGVVTTASVQLRRFFSSLQSKVFLNCFDSPILSMHLSFPQMENCRWVEWVQEMKAEDMVSLCFIPQDNYPPTATFLGLIVGSSCIQVIYSGGGMLVINQPRAHHMSTETRVTNPYRRNNAIHDTQTNIYAVSLDYIRY